jgi:hypothetical protein
VPFGPTVQSEVGLPSLCRGLPGGSILSQAHDDWTLVSRGGGSQGQRTPQGSLPPHLTRKSPVEPA